MNLVFNRGAVAWADTFDHPGEHGRAVQPAANDVVRLRIGVGHPAGQLRRVHAAGAEEGKHRNRGVAALFRELRKVDGLAVQARRCSGFEARLRQLQLSQRAT